jgi:hypothetical protein
VTGRRLAAWCLHTLGTVCMCALVAVAVMLAVLAGSAALARVDTDPGGYEDGPIMVSVPA